MCSLKRLVLLFLGTAAVVYGCSVTTPATTTTTTITVPLTTTTTTMMPMTLECTFECPDGAAGLGIVGATEAGGVCTIPAGFGAEVPIGTAAGCPGIVDITGANLACVTDPDPLFNTNCDDGRLRVHPGRGGGRGPDDSLSLQCSPDGVLTGLVFTEGGGTISMISGIESIACA